MPLTNDQLLNCVGCSDTDINIYVDDVVQTMINFLEAVTCIPWFRTHENIDRPDLPDTGERKGQYGMIEIVLSERVNTQKPVSEINAVSENTDDNARCYVIHSERDLTAVLTIYRETGAADRDQFDAGYQSPVGAGIDHLERLQDLYEADRIRKLLTAKKIAIKDFGVREWNKELVSNTWENIGEMQIVLNVCSQSSYTDRNMKCIELKFCEDDPELICEEFLGCDSEGNPI